MRYEYVGILCGADDSILELKYEDIEFNKETLDKDELKGKYGLDPSSSIYIDGAYEWKEDNKFEIIKIIIANEKKGIDDRELNLDFEIEQYMHKQIDFFISTMNMITDGFLYVVCPMIHVKNLISGGEVPCGFPYELPNSNFRGCSDSNRRDRHLEKFDSKYLTENLNFIRDNEILNTVKDYYNHYKWTHNRAIELTTLMTCLETLLLKNKGELSHRISRNVAVLFSKSRDEGKKIYERMKKLYDIRSKIVHDGIFDCTKYQNKYGSYPPFDIKKIVYDVILLYLENKFEKDSFVDELESLGYGDFKIEVCRKSTQNFV